MAGPYKIVGIDDDGLLPDRAMAAFDERYEGKIQESADSLGVDIKNSTNEEFRRGLSPAIDSGEQHYGERLLSGVRMTNREISNSASWLLENQLRIPLYKGRIYKVRADLYFAMAVGNDGAPNIKISLKGRYSSSHRAIFMSEDIDPAASFTWDDVLTLQTSSTSNRRYRARIDGTIIMDSTGGGEIYVEWGQSIARDSTLTLLRGSSIVAEPLPENLLTDDQDITLEGKRRPVNFAGKPWNITNVKDSPSYVRIEVRKGDRRIADEHTYSDNRERCEIAGDLDGGDRFTVGEKHWRGFDVKLTGNFILPGRWNGSALAGYLMLSQAVQREHGSVFNLSVGNEVSSHPGHFWIASTSAENGYERHWVSDNPVVEGDIYRFVFRLEFGPSGSIEAWFNEQKVVDKIGVPLGFPVVTGDQRPTYTIGQYSSQREDTLVTEFGNYIYGASPNSEYAQRTTTPLPWPGPE